MSDVKFPIEAGHIMMFARSLGEKNNIYSDADYARTTEIGHVIAPPTFTQAMVQYIPDYLYRPKVDEPWFGSGKTASGTSQQNSESNEPGVLHAEQHFEYERFPKPGDVLTATSKEGRTWTKQGRRSGKLTFFESITEFRDQDGQLVLRARNVGVRPERPPKTI